MQLIQNCFLNDKFIITAWSTEVAVFDTMGSQADVVDINHAFHLYYKCCMWIEFQSTGLYKSRHPAKFSLASQSKYVEEMDPQPSTFHKTPAT